MDTNNMQHISYILLINKINKYKKINQDLINIINKQQKDLDDYKLSLNTSINNQKELETIINDVYIYD
jgi:hypothetical protein